ncbi:MAG: xanthine dehydrogenase family protein subunit M [Actinobacteria bacterium]|nr:xanthine dehydrogenase family protein subunit M [Actinomycetota bacterium]
MKPTPFEYHRAETTEEAVRLLVECGEEAKVLAGGQSLVPTMNLRLAQPSALIDIAGIGGLAGIAREGGSLRVGATTRQSAVLADPEIAVDAPMVAEALRWVGHEANRNRGTFGGSAAHADPAAEIPAVLVALGADLEITGPRGFRTVPAADFFVSFFTTSIEPDELLTAVRLPSRHGPWAFEEIARRHGDFALVGVAAALVVDEQGIVGACDLVLMGVDDVPWSAQAAQEVVVGNRVTPELAREARAVIESTVEPSSDVHASSCYRSHAAGVLVERALLKATGRKEQG